MQGSLHSCPSDSPVCWGPFSLSTFRSPNSRFFSGSKSSEFCISQGSASKTVRILQNKSKAYNFCSLTVANESRDHVVTLKQWEVNRKRQRCWHLMWWKLWNCCKENWTNRVGSKLYIMEIMFSPSSHPLEEGLVHILQPSNWMCTPASPKDIVSVHQKL